MKTLPESPLKILESKDNVTVAKFIEYYKNYKKTGKFWYSMLQTFSENPKTTSIRPIFKKKRTLQNLKPQARRRFKLLFIDPKKISSWKYYVFYKFISIRIYGCMQKKLEYQLCFDIKKAPEE